MTRISRIRLVSIIALILALTVMPLAGARPVDNRAVHQADGGWFAAALNWLENLGFHRPVPDHHQPSSQSTQKDSSSVNSTTGGSCIDPMGRPRPWCE